MWQVKQVYVSFMLYCCTTHVVLCCYCEYCCLLIKWPLVKKYKFDDSYKLSWGSWVSFVDCPLQLTMLINSTGWLGTWCIAIIKLSTMSKNLYMCVYEDSDLFCQPQLVFSQFVLKYLCTGLSSLFFVKQWQCTKYLYYTFKQCFEKMTFYPGFHYLTV